MEAIERLLEWARSNNVLMNGIGPRPLSGRGIGIVATRDIEANQEVLTVPISLLRTLESTPRSIVHRLKGARVHAILATALCLEASVDFEIWRAVLPCEETISSCMPLNWPDELQRLLPAQAQTILSKQRANFCQDWSLVSSAYTPQELCESSFRHAWHLVNSRTFYHTGRKTVHRPADDHMALQPVADLFNHAPDGCAASFDDVSFSITTTRRYGVGEEVFLRYGSHSNDFLLVEYGFALPHNPCDEICLDPYMSPLFGDDQAMRLEEAGFWANYMLDAQTACYRAQTALRMLCVSYEQWRAVLDGRRDEDEDRDAIDRALLGVLKTCQEDISGKVLEVAACDEGMPIMRDSLHQRWLQMRDLVALSMARIQSRPEIR